MKEYPSGAVNISLSKAERIIDSYKNVYPAVFEYMEFVNDFIRNNGYAYTIFGRRRNLLDVFSNERSVVNRALRQGLNFTIQSTASDILLVSLLGASRNFKRNNLSARAVATVHDSIEVVCPHDEVKETLSILHEEMVNYPTIKKLFNIYFDIPLKIDVEVGTSFGNGTLVEFKEGVPML